jgi:hypothetical protein
MKKIFFMLFVIAIITSCKKDDGGSSATSTPVEGYRVDSGKISLITPSATNFNLDYSNITKGAAWKDTLRIPTNSRFAGATYMTTTSINLFNQNVGVSTYFQKDATTWKDLGDDFGNNVNLTLATMSASITDGVATKTPTLTLANFPLNYSDSFQSNSSSSLTLNVNYSGAAIPVTVNLATIGNSKIIAQGTMKLNGYTSALNTVVQKYTRKITTSVSISPAYQIFQSYLNTQLANYGFDSNGQKIDTLIEYRYWAADKRLVMTQYANTSATVTTGL